MSDIYYAPEKHGLTFAGEVEWSEPYYSFDLTAVWKDADGNLYWASDSGCSCPAPFEWADRVDLNAGSFHDLAAALNRRLGESSSDSDREYAAPQIVDLLARLR